MNYLLLSTYILAILALLITPGPVIALVTSTAIRYGYKRAFATVLGADIASLVLIVFAALILTGVISLSPAYLSALGIAGSCFIGFSAVGNIISVKNAESRDSTQKKGTGGLLPGFITGVSNPKDILFFVSFFPQFITITTDFNRSILTLSAVWIFFDFLVLSIYIVAVKRWVSEKHEQLSILISSLFLLIIAICGAVFNIGHFFTGYR